MANYLSECIWLFASFLPLSAAASTLASPNGLTDGLATGSNDSGTRRHIPSVLDQAPLFGRADRVRICLISFQERPTFDTLTMQRFVDSVLAQRPGIVHVHIFANTGMKHVLRGQQFVIHFHMFTKAMLVSRVERVLGERPSMFASAYKLACDLRPMFAALFLSDCMAAGGARYEYWGWTDTDIILGNLSILFDDASPYQLREDVLAMEAQKGMGPFSIFRNTERTRSLFRHSNAWRGVVRSWFRFEFDEAWITHANRNSIDCLWGLLHGSESYCYSWALWYLCRLVPATPCRVEGIAYAAFKAKLTIRVHPELYTHKPRWHRLRYTYEAGRLTYDGHSGGRQDAILCHRCEFCVPSTSNSRLLHCNKPAKGYKPPRILVVAMGKDNGSAVGIAERVAARLVRVMPNDRVVVRPHASDAWEIARDSQIGDTQVAIIDDLRAAAHRTRDELTDMFDACATFLDCRHALHRVLRAGVKWASLAFKFNATVTNVHTGLSIGY